MDGSNWFTTTLELVASINGQTWAAWIQTIGTFVGILTAWLVGNRQWRKHLQLEAERDLQSVKATYVLIQRAAQLVKVGAQNLRSPLPAQPSKAALSSLENLAVQLERFVFVRSPAPDVIRISLSGANAIRKYLGLIERVVDPLNAASAERACAISTELERYAELLLKNYGITEENW